MQIKRRDAQRLPLRFKPALDGYRIGQVVVDKRGKIVPERGLAQPATGCLFNRQVGTSSAQVPCARSRGHATVGGMDAFMLNPTRVRDILDLVLDAQDYLRILSARKLAATTPQKPLLCGVRHGLYGFPTLARASPGAAPSRPAQALACWPRAWAPRRPRSFFRRSKAYTAVVKVMAERSWSESAVRARVAGTDFCHRGLDQGRRRGGLLRLLARRE